MRLSDVAPEISWGNLFDSGVKLSAVASFGPHKIPPDWLAINGGKLKPAVGFATVFGYDAIRIPVYLILSGQFDHVVIKRLAELWSKSDSFAMTELDSGVALWRFNDDYAAVRQLVLSAVSIGCASLLPSQYKEKMDYYPATLALLVSIAEIQLNKYHSERCQTNN